MGGSSRPALAGNDGLRPLNRALATPRAGRWHAQRQSRPPVSSRRRRSRFTARLQRRGEPLSLGRRLLLAVCLCGQLARLGGDVSEGDGALDRLAREDGLVAPVDEDADVAEAVGHGDEIEIGGPSQREASARQRPGQGRADISGSAWCRALPVEGARSSSGRRSKGATRIGRQARVGERDRKSCY